MRKVRIKQVPNMAWGGRIFNQVAPNALPDRMDEPMLSVSSTLGAVPRDEANIEAERNEMVHMPDDSGMSALYKVGGKRHSEGGTPLNVPEDSFVFSDTRAMTIKNKEILKQFGETSPKTPADIAKKYDINKYRKVLLDVDSDKIQKDTAERMIGNNNIMLGKLALVQESMKGFPQGIPVIAYPYMMANNLKPEDILPMSKQQQGAEQENPQEQMSQGYQEEPMMGKYGIQYSHGGMHSGRKVRIKSLPMAQGGFQFPWQAPAQNAAALPADPLTQNIAGNNWAGHQRSQTPAPANGIMLSQANVPGFEERQKAEEIAAAINTASVNPAATSNAKTSATSTPQTSNVDDLVNFNKKFWDEYYGIEKSGKIVADLPGVNFTEEERQRKSTQGERGKGTNIYGDRDWNTGNEWSDFQRRHQWYLKDHADFDPKNKDHVAKFQQEYCKRASSFGMEGCYFIQGDKKGTGFDGKFGEHTWAAPGFNSPTQQVAAEEKKPGAKQEDIKTNKLQTPPEYNPYEFYPQDMLNLAVAMGQRIPDPQTFYNTLAYQAYSPAYIKEDYSPIMEAANISTQGINAYGSRQSADASLSAIQGKSARGAADHNLQIANINTGIYNDAEKFNAQMMQANAMYNLGQKERNFDTEQAYAADRIKAKNTKRAEVANLWNTALTNATDTYNLNLMNPQYKIFPGTGGLAAFTNGRPMQPNPSSDISPRVQEYEMLKAKGYTHDEAIDLVGRQSGKAQYPNENYPYFNPYDYMTGPTT